MDHRRAGVGRVATRKNPNCAVQMLYLATAVSELHPEKTQARI